MYPATKSTGTEHNILKAKNTFPINFICFAPCVLLFVSKTMATIIDTTASIAIATANIQNRIIVGVFSIISTSPGKSRAIDNRPYGFYCCPCVFCNTPFLLFSIIYLLPMLCDFSHPKARQWPYQHSNQWAYKYPGCL